MTHTQTRERAALRAVLYLRDVTSEIESQRRDCLDYCTQHDYDVVGEYVDDVNRSGSKRSRASFERMTRDAELDQFDVIVSFRFDRLWRRPAEAERLVDLHGRLGLLFAEVQA